MSDILRSPARTLTRPTWAATLLDGTRFDFLFALLAAWLLGGLYLDGWAHNNLAETLESFVTPWHGVFYAGFGATAALLIGATIRRQKAGRDWSGAIPDGYRPSMAGVALFAVGGVADSIWHTLLGIEVSVDALVSPPHLLLALGLGLIVSGPLRAAWRGTEAPEGIGLVAATLSLALLLSLLTFFTQFAHPFVEAWSAESNLRDHAPFLVALPETLTGEITPLIGVTAILLQAGVLMGALLAVMRRWALPFGSVTAVVGLNVVLLSFLNDQQRLIPAALVAGVAADLLAQRLRVSSDRRGFMLFAFALPATLYLLYFATLFATDRIVWPAALAAGSIVLAGIVGSLVALILGANESAARSWAQTSA
ncbi:MAG: hypothetical protein C0498_13865 [Anaerolinea sp.]|nr:hypothetical protein [Anaerolinea sp.]